MIEFIADTNPVMAPSPVTVEAAEAATKRERAEVTAHTYAADLIQASPEQFDLGMAYVLERTVVDKPYGEDIIDKLDLFDNLPDSEKSHLTPDQLQVYKERSNQVTTALMQVLAPLPAPVLPQ